MKDGRIAYIGASEPEEDFGERYDGRHRLLMTAFYNVHSHAPMTLLRGYAENLPLQRWLGEKVFPFEDQIDDEAAYYGTLLAISEMLASGTASFLICTFSSAAWSRLSSRAASSATSAAA